VKIFFDVDETILSYDGSLRPHVHEIFALLHSEGHELYLWSAVGIRTEVVEKFALQAWVTACYRKPVGSAVSIRSQLELPVTPDFCIDDYPEPVAAFGGVLIQPYAYATEDDEMIRVYRSIQEHVLKDVTRPPQATTKQDREQR
jgi:hypothetical protein